MARNPYFKFQAGEQNVSEDIIVEIIKMMGQNVWYIPREFVNLDRLFGEDQLNKFTKAYQIEMYLASVAGYEGTDVITKFGLEVKDRVTLVVSRKRFTNEVTTHSSTIVRPREGDIIYFPLSKTMFEINFVEHETPFYQLDKLYVYTLSCETFNYSAEQFATGNSEMDTISNVKQSTYTFYANINGVGFQTAYSNLTLGEKMYISGSLAGTTAYFRLLDYTLNQDNLELEIMALDGVTFLDPTVITRVNTGNTFGLLTTENTGNYGIINPILGDADGENPPLDYQRGFTGAGSKYDIPIINFSETDPFSQGNY